MKKEDLKNIPEEIVLKAVETYLEAERDVSRWRSIDAGIPSYEMSETMRFLLTCFDDELDFAALLHTMADEPMEARTMRFPSRRSLEAEEKRQAVYKYGQLKESGYEYTWTEIARLSGVGSISEAKKYFREMKEREARKKDETSQEEQESRLVARIEKFLLFKIKIEIKKEGG